MLIQTIYLFFMALILAIIEVQIEGENGWASKLPTWRPKEGSGLDRFFSKMMSGKPTTGYHIAVFSFVLLIMHYPFFAGASWSWTSELQTLSLFLLFSAVWDLLWIVVNPHFGIKKIGVDHIWWHSKRAGIIPFDYILAFVGSFVLYIPLLYFNGNYFFDWLTTVVVFGVLTFITVILTPEERERWKVE
ncbi:MAG: hypothetical protein ABIC82_06400 [bacterium]